MGTARIPFPTSLLTKVVIICFLSSFLIQRYTHLPLWLGSLLKDNLKRPWTIITAGFNTVDLASLTFGIASVLFYTTKLDKSWTVGEIALLYIISVVPSSIAFLMIQVAFTILSNASYQYTTISGLLAFLGGLAVAVMYADPNVTLQIMPKIKINSSMLPCMLLVTAIIPSIMTRSFFPTIATSIGIVFSYWYLRFIRVQERRWGDLSITTMSFSFMFPSITEPLGVLLAKGAFVLALKLDRWDLLKDWREEYYDEETRPAALSNKGQSTKELERRRLLALNLLNQKMAQKQLDISNAAKEECPYNEPSNCSDRTNN